jgi:hypothetical protein
MVKATNELMNIDDFQNVEGGKCKKKASKGHYIILKLGKILFLLRRKLF